LQERKEIDELSCIIAVDEQGKSFYGLDVKVRHKIVADGITDPEFDMAKRCF
jgi:UPF0176 protein